MGKTSYTALTAKYRDDINRLCDATKVTRVDNDPLSTLSTIQERLRILSPNDSNYSLSEKADEVVPMLMKLVFPDEHSPNGPDVGTSPYGTPGMPPRAPRDGYSWVAVATGGDPIGWTETPMVREEEEEDD